MNLEIALGLLPALLYGVAASHPADPPPSASADLLIGNVSVITLTETGILENRHVLVRDGIVTDVASMPASHWPADIPFVDGSGRFLLPALNDLHVHIFDERDLEVYALMGIATVRNMDGWSWHLDLARAARQSDAWQARLITTGAQYQPPLVANADDVARLVALESERGFSWIKAYNGLDLEQLRALAGAARSHRMRVTGHLPDGIPATEALATGAFADVAHAEELLQWYRAVPELEVAGGQKPPLDLLACAFSAHGTALVTTLVNNRMILDQLSDLEANLAREEVGLAGPLVQVFWRSRWNPNARSFGTETIERMRHNQHALEALIVGLHRRGVTLLAGTDAPNPTTVPAASLYTELELLVEAGLTPEEAIRTATVAPAVHLGDPQGAHIRPGARADFLLLSGDPTKDLMPLRQPAGVVLRGRYRDRASIDTRLLELRTIYAQEGRLLSRFDPASPLAILEDLDRRPAGATPPLSAAALTSLVWVYTKFGNFAAAQTVATRLLRDYPGASSERVLAAAVASAGL